MDVDGDGKIDILSGSYSRLEGSMAGLFQVLRGTEAGFAKPTPLLGTDGNPLTMPSSEEDPTTSICTRPFAVDWDGDGHLDIVTGNFRGEFQWFRGTGPGKYEPKAAVIQGAKGPLSVPMHSDPFVIDWDRDGDLDLVSGAADGSVRLFWNTGTRQAPVFEHTVLLLQSKGHGDREEVLTKAPTLDRPQGSARVWIDDVNGDGKWDLLVGDSVAYEVYAEGVDPEEGARRLAEWTAKMSKIFERFPEDGEPDKDLEAEYEAHFALRESIVKQHMYGSVWLLLGA
ncbi:MAG: VCBS repeat-containing protein [Planctomycetota bacterium]